MAGVRQTRDGAGWRPPTKPSCPGLARASRSPASGPRTSMAGTSPAMKDTANKDDAATAQSERFNRLA